MASALQTNMYSLGFAEITESLIALGHKRTLLLEGHMGIGKSSMLTDLARRMPDHTPCYFDCTTKDLGDIMIPNIQMLDGEGKFVKYLTNEEIGAHLDTPIILMIDELGKANRSVQNALRRAMLERKIGSYELHSESVVFATTNLGAENVGDLIEPHKRNALVKVQVRKPTAEEWLVDFAVPNGLNHFVQAFVQEFPQVMESFENVKVPADNPYIFHPQEYREAFVTGRSLHAASDILNTCGHLSRDALTGLLIGTIGVRASMDLMTFVDLAHKLPSIKDIKANPEGADVPDTPSGVCMTVFKMLNAIPHDRELITPWFKYMKRLAKEPQAMFIQGVAKPHYPAHEWVTSHSQFGDWAISHSYLFHSDK